MNKDKFVSKLKSFKTWLFGLKIGIVGIALWWIIKIIICLTSGICIIF